jgi:proteasome lid subunit RPN8/RPN11
MFRAREAPAREDFAEPENALTTAYEKYRARWFVDRGSSGSSVGIIVYTEFPPRPDYSLRKERVEYYEKRVLFFKNGLYHWPAQGKKVFSLPKDAKPIIPVKEERRRDEGPQLLQLGRVREASEGDDWDKRECVIHGRGDCSCPPRTRVPAGTTDEDLRAANELVLFAESTGSLYPEKIEIYRKLRELQATNRYNDNTAWRVWTPWVASAAEVYRKEFKGRSTIQTPLSARAMEIAAKTIAEHHAIPLWRGEYDEIIWKPTPGSMANETLDNPRGPKCGPDPHSGKWAHRGGCCPGRPTCRYQRREVGLCYCEAYHYPHRSGSGRCVYGPEGIARMDRWVYGPRRDAEEERQEELHKSGSSPSGWGANDGARALEAREQEAPAGEAAAVPWVKLERDPEKYREAMARAKEIGPIKTARAVYEMLAPGLAKEDQEVFLVTAIDARGQCRDVVEVHRGGQSRVAVEVPVIMRAATALGGEMFVVIHNHPTGHAKPSPADRELTETIQKAAEASQLVFMDHVIIGLDEFYSFAEDELTKVRRAKREKRSA